MFPTNCRLPALLCALLVSPCLWAALEGEQDGRIARAEESLRATEATEQRLLREYARQITSGELSRQEAREYQAYLEKLRNTVERHRLQVARLRAGSSMVPEEAVGLEEASPFSAQDARTEEEKLSILDAELDSSLGDFDEMLLREQAELSKKAKSKQAGTIPERSEDSETRSNSPGGGQGSMSGSTPKGGKQRKGDRAPGSGEQSGGEASKQSGKADGGREGGKGSRSGESGRVGDKGRQQAGRKGAQGDKSGSSKGQQAGNQQGGKRKSGDGSGKDAAGEGKGKQGSGKGSGQQRQGSGKGMAQQGAGQQGSRSGEGQGGRGTGVAPRLPGMQGSPERAASGKMGSPPGMASSGAQQSGQVGGQSGGGRLGGRPGEPAQPVYGSSGGKRGGGIAPPIGGRGGVALGSEDDDIIARQLREAAEKERDPELKKRLWDEYYRYKESTREE